MPQNRLAVTTPNSALVNIPESIVIYSFVERQRSAVAVSHPLKRFDSLDDFYPLFY